MVIAKVWTDGGIGPRNPGGDMGWAARIEVHKTPDAVTSVSTEPLVIHTWGRADAALNNTNQVAEMKAIKAALLVLQDHPQLRITSIQITSDSQWCIMQMSRQKFIDAGKKPWARTAHIAEWNDIELLLSKYGEHDFIHTRGHMKTGDWRNEVCDKLEKAARAGTVTEAMLASILKLGEK